MGDRQRFRTSVFRESEVGMIEVDTANSQFVTRREIWFNTEERPFGSAANNLYYQSLVEPRMNVVRLTDFSTLIHDLSMSSETLMGGMKSRLRSQVRQASRVGITACVVDVADDAELVAFLASANRWAAHKGRSSFNAGRFKCMATSGQLVVIKSQVSESTVGYHSYVHDDSRARLLTSHHDPRVSDVKVVGLANKLLHWESMLHFKEMGLRVYDMGGYDAKLTPGIARLKESFGGQLERSWNFKIERGVYRVASAVRRFYMSGKRSGLVAPPANGDE